MYNRWPSSVPSSCVIYVSPSTSVGFLRNCASVPADRNFHYCPFRSVPSAMPTGPVNRNIQSSRVITYSQGVWKKYVVTIICCIRTKNFPSRGIGTWKKVRDNGGYVVNGVRCNATRLYMPSTQFSIAVHNLGPFESVQIFTYRKTRDISDLCGLHNLSEIRYIRGHSYCFVLWGPKILFVIWRLSDIHESDIFDISDYSI